MSLVLQSIWAAVLALSGKYDELFTYVMFMMVLSYVLTVAGLYYSCFGASSRDTPRPYRCTGYPWVPAIYIVLGSLWAINAAIEKEKRDAGGDSDCCVGRTVLFLLEETKKDRGRATIDWVINLSEFVLCHKAQGPSGLLAP